MLSVLHWKSLRRRVRHDRHARVDMMDKRNRKPGFPYAIAIARGPALLMSVVVLLALGCDLAFVSKNVIAQKRPRRRPATRAVSSSAIDYAHFSHATKKHQAACNTCHKVPTNNWKQVRDFPDVADFPDHDACISCHRPQFFKGARPVICSDCHSKVSPRDEARFSFRNPAADRQFLIEFPHDKHQDVIANLIRNDQRTRTVRYIAATFSLADDTKHYNNCEICHQPRTDSVKPANGWPDAFQPPADTFKLAPLGHASCFNCHWKAQEPVKDNCGGCHKLASKPYAAIDAPQRISLRFRHGREQHVAECSTCHINITKSATLRGLKPDVPITACTECHNKDGLRQDLTKELVAVDKDATFVCSYCHTSDVGRRDPPAGHYLIAGMTPKKRK